MVYAECRSATANLRLVAASGGPSRPLTDGPWRDTSPRWSPDGKMVAWLSDRGGKPAIRLCSREGAAERALETGSLEPLAFAWSPEGDSVAFTAAVEVRQDPPRWAPSDLLPRLRHLRETVVHLFVQPLDPDKRPQEISSAYLDLRGEPAWMPDGRTILSAAADGRLYAFAAAGGAPRVLASAGTRNECPLPSPDGARIAWLQTAGAGQSYATRKLAVMSPDGSRVRILSGSLDRDAAAPQWSSDSRTVYFLADDRGSTHVNAARNDGTLRQATKAVERLSGFSLADNGRAVSVRSAPLAAGDVYTFTVDHASEPATLAAPAAGLLAAREAGAVEEISWRSAGHSVQGWLVRPPGFDPSKKYPLLLDIRDNPRKMYGPDFNLRAQILAGSGFVVLCANPRGTAGYGEEFGNLLQTRYPGDDFDDLMAGVDLAVSRPYIDSARLSVVGGLLAAWAIGHTARFRSAVVVRPVADWLAEIALAPGGVERALTLMGAMPWDNPDQYVKHSPIYFAANFRTPTLIVASEGDPQAEELWFALGVRKVDCAFVHLKPSETAAELEAILAWLKR